jgi:amino acid permease
VVCRPADPRRCLDHGDAVILAAVFIIFAGYLAVGFAGYLAYPTTVDSNVLKSFPKRPVLLKASARAHRADNLHVLR